MKRKEFISTGLDDFRWCDGDEKENCEDGTILKNTFNNFVDGELNNDKGGERCGLLNTELERGQWTSDLCTRNIYFICQRSIRKY